MNNFWTLVGFELKKIFTRKSVIIATLSALILNGIICASVVFGDYYIDGKFLETHYDGMKIDKEYARSFTGKVLDTDMILEASDAYKTINTDIIPYSKDPNYHKNARAYSLIYNAVNRVYGIYDDNFTIKEWQNITKSQADEFYEIRDIGMSDGIDNKMLSESSKDKLLKLNSQIETPFKIGYSEGYNRFISHVTASGILVFVLIIFIISPIFANEYSNKTDNLILSSKNGKGSLILAKLFTGSVINITISVVFLLMSYFLCMFIFGFDGKDLPIQLRTTGYVYPFTFLKVSAILSICMVIGGFFMSCICMLISSASKNSFGVIALCFVIIFAGLYTDNFEGLPFDLLPTKLFNSFILFETTLYEVFGQSIVPFVFIPIVGALISCVLLPLSYTTFKNHQVS